MYDEPTRLMPRVSVVIPTYNRSALVQQAIDSVLTQSYNSYEVIVVDDGSTDGTEEDLRDRYGSKIRYVWQENEGESSARNRGIELARGEYIAFLDSDDMWKPTKIEKQVQVLDGVESDVGFVFSSALVVDRDGNVKEPQIVGRIDRDDQSVSDLIFSPFVFAAASNILVRKEIMDEIGGFDTSVRYGEDWLLVVELVAKWKFSYIDEPLLYYRQYSGNQQNSGDINKVRRLLKDGFYALDRAAQYIEDQALIAKARARRLEQAAMFCFLESSTEQGAKYLGEAFEWDSTRKADSGSGSRLVSRYLVAWLLQQSDQDIGSLDRLVRQKILPICKTWFEDKSEERTFRNQILGLTYEGWLRGMQNATLRTKVKFLARSYWYYPRRAVIRRVVQAALRRTTFSVESAKRFA